jgi:hypothetical protein
MPPLDVSQVDGPFDPQRTADAARLVADGVRYLNHASHRGGGIAQAADVFEVLGSLGVAAGRLRQTFEQLGQCLEGDLATGRLRIGEGAPHADDPAAGVQAARLQLQLVSQTARELELGLGEVQRLVSGMSLDPG